MGKEAHRLKKIRQKLIYSLFIIVLCNIGFIYFLYSKIYTGTVILLIADIFLIVLVAKFYGQLQAARLICENPILCVDVASISDTKNNIQTPSVNVIVSGFGIMIENTPYKFGQNDMRLISATLDKQYLNLTFGNNEKVISAKLLHGLDCRTKKDEIVEKMRYETGVVATII